MHVHVVVVERGEVSDTQTDFIVLGAEQLLLDGDGFKVHGFRVLGIKKQMTYLRYM